MEVPLLVGMLAVFVLRMTVNVYLELSFVVVLKLAYFLSLNLQLYSSVGSLSSSHEYFGMIKVGHCFE